ncbi:hypothetical protein [Corynebacterium glutamicum]|uniref:hypothetical protein n=1 Tax=Corynebacterium glutamicum TaxID=1718 RepID=UPI000AA79C23|nr:hypothetical protein [Corynebacterium glutamicum]
MTEPDDLQALFELETFESGGRELWDGMRDPRDPADVVALVVETCRVKDRLDRLHRLGSRDDHEWGRIIPHRVRPVHRDPGGAEDFRGP